MQRTTVQVGPFEVNCSVLAWGDRAWIVDPGAEPDRIAAVLERARLAPEAILLTHGHFDHIGAIPTLQSKWPGLKVYMHPADERIITHPLNSFPPDYPAIGRPANVCDVRELEGVHSLKPIFTPGHTPGGMCYFFQDDGLLLSGDTLFAGSVGRTDLPGGDMATLMDSIDALKALPDATEVVPGHGCATTIGREKASNPFLLRG